MENDIIVAPSLLAADFLRLHEEVEMINHSEAEWLHLDVMDGQFVPNISFGFPVIRAVGRECRKVMDAHFMIFEPWKYVKKAKDCGCHNMTFHYETCKDRCSEMVDMIHDAGMKAGMSVKPGTPVEVYEEILPKLDLALVMTVEPGFGGQKFMGDMMQKVEWLRRKIDENHYHCLIEIDGGVNTETAKVARKAGVDVLVAGSFVFGAEEPEKTIISLKN